MHDLIQQVVYIESMALCRYRSRQNGRGDTVKKFGGLVCLGINFPAQLLRSCQIMQKMFGSVGSHRMAPDWPQVQRTGALSFMMSIRYC